MKKYKNYKTAYNAAGKKSLFANLNGKFSQFDVIEQNYNYYVVESGKYPQGQFNVISQFSAGYSI
jgi:hypothetical protein